jgi:hypothetical protein
MGQPDFYPFTLPSAVLAKLQFIHLVVTSSDAPVAVPQPMVQNEPLLMAA